MALFDRLKHLFSDAGKENTDTADLTEPTATINKATAPVADAAEGQTEKTGMEPEPGSEEYLLWELNQSREVFPGELDAVAPRVYSILEAVKNRIERIEFYRQWQEQEDTGEKTASPINSMDAEAKVFCGSDRMAGFVYCLGPVGDGAELTKEALLKAVSDCGIRYGIDEAMLAGIVEGRKYHRIFTVARGTAPIKGEDGQVIDHFSREQVIRLQEDEKGNIDHKNVGVFQTVQKGQVICEFIQPKEGTNGRDVMGNEVHAEKGSMPPVPKGKNTVLNEDGSALLADEDGDISFHHDVFRVEPQLTINGDVDNTTGNINFAGNVFISGEVLRGFSVTAGGTLTVLGMVEGAVLSAGEDIILAKGMNGTNGGSLTAKGSIRSRFLEQATIVAEGDVIASAMINCDVRAGGNIEALTGKGILIGGKLRAGQSVQARQIGNQSDACTIVKVGVAVQKKENANEVAKELAEAKKTLEKITQNLKYLNSLPAIPEKNRDLYDTLIRQEKMYRELVGNLMAKIDELESRVIDYSKCSVRGDMIYGITEIFLDRCRLCIRDTTPRCNVYFSKEKGELVVGSF